LQHIVDSEQKKEAEMAASARSGSGEVQFSNLAKRVVDRAVEIQQIAAPPFGEAARAAFVFEKFRAGGLADVSLDEMGNVFGRLPGAGSARPLVVSAHLDTVFPLSTDLSVRCEPEKIYGPGIGDNSLGVAGLFGLLWALRQQQPEDANRLNTDLPGDIWLVANVGEEGLGDLRGMRQVVRRFAGLAGGKGCLAYLVLEGMALGQVYHRALEVQRYRVTVRTAGGHSWVDYGRPSANHELAALIARLTAIPLPAQPRSTLNVGLIAGGTGVNVIAAEACLELDLRSEAGHTLEDLAWQVQLLCQELNRPGVQVTYDVIGHRPTGQLAASHPLVQLAKRTIQSLGLDANLTIGSTDANIPLSQGLPAITLGISTGYGAHTQGEYIHTPPIALGLAQLGMVVKAAFQELA
jgi:tripeptide aminopeptidase